MTLLWIVSRVLTSGTMHSTSPPHCKIKFSSSLSLCLCLPVCLSVSVSLCSISVHLSVSVSLSLSVSVFLSLSLSISPPLPSLSLSLSLFSAVCLSYYCPNWYCSPKPHATASSELRTPSHCLLVWLMSTECQQTYGVLT